MTRADCLQCGSTSHRQAQCPQGVIRIADKQSTFEDDEDVEVYVPTDEMFLEAEADLEQQRQD